MFYLVGLGLNEKGYSREAYDIISESKRIYLENYTVDFPYEISVLEKQFENKEFLEADRNFIESFKILDDAKREDVVLLVYGSPLTATTHISLIQEARKRKIKCRIIHGASILDVVAETGLQLYKFGKVVSVPNFDADSYIDVIKENLNIGAHTLILVDIGMKFHDFLDRLEKDSKGKIEIKKMIVGECLGTKDSRVYYDSINKLKTLEIKNPFCLIVPGKLHFLEEELLDNHNS